MLTEFSRNCGDAAGSSRADRSPGGAADQRFLVSPQVRGVNAASSSPEDRGFKSRPRHCVKFKVPCHLDVPSSGSLARRRHRYGLGQILFDLGVVAWNSPSYGRASLATPDNCRPEVEGLLGWACTGGHTRHPSQASMFSGPPSPLLECRTYPRRSCAGVSSMDRRPRAPREHGHRSGQRTTRWRAHVSPLPLACVGPAPPPVPCGPASTKVRRVAFLSNCSTIEADARSCRHDVIDPRSHGSSTRAAT